MTIYCQCLSQHHVSSWPNHLVATSSRSALTVSVGDDARQVPEADPQLLRQCPHTLPVVQVAHIGPVVPQVVLDVAQEAV